MATESVLPAEEATRTGLSVNSRARLLATSTRAAAPSATGDESIELMGSEIIRERLKTSGLMARRNMVLGVFTPLRWALDGKAGEAFALYPVLMHVAAHEQRIERHG
ncbi:MAG: hypothetical protein L6435_01630 [Anaerolineae bacterium]|nr:hypothetical protein [Anaerolineae bacterium]